MWNGVRHGVADRLLNNSHWQPVKQDLLLWVTFSSCKRSLKYLVRWIVKHFLSFGSIIINEIICWRFPYYSTSFPFFGFFVDLLGDFLTDFGHFLNSVWATRIAADKSRLGSARLNFFKAEADADPVSFTDLVILWTNFC